MSSAPTPSSSSVAEALVKGGLHASSAQWDQCAEKYDASFATAMTGLHARWALEQVLEAAGERRGLALCDIACGSGVLSLAAAACTDRVASVLASDYSSVMCQLLESKYLLLESAAIAPVAPLKTLVADAQDLSALQSDSFDITCCIFGIMLIPDPVKAAREIVRITKPGGLVVFAAWDMEGSQMHTLFANISAHIGEKKAQQAPAATAGASGGAATSSEAVKPEGALHLMPFQRASDFEQLFSTVSLQPVLLTTHLENSGMYPNADIFWRSVQGAAPAFPDDTEQAAQWAREWIDRVWGAKAPFQLTSSSVIAIGRKAA